PQKLPALRRQKLLGPKKLPGARPWKLQQQRQQPLPRLRRRQRLQEWQKRKPRLQKRKARLPNRLLLLRRKSRKKTFLAISLRTWKNRWAILFPPALHRPTPNLSIRRLQRPLRQCQNRYWIFPLRLQFHRQPMAECATPNQLLC